MVAATNKNLATPNEKLNVSESNVDVIAMISVAKKSADELIVSESKVVAASKNEKLIVNKSMAAATKNKRKLRSASVPINRRSKSEQIVENITPESPVDSSLGWRWKKNGAEAKNKNVDGRENEIENVIMNNYAAAIRIDDVEQFAATQREERRHSSHEASLAFNDEAYDRWKIVVPGFVHPSILVETVHRKGLEFRGFSPPV
jgi:hypothetical protein